MEKNRSANYVFIRKINISFVEYTINKIFCEFHSPVVKMWSILDAYMVIKCNAEKRNNLWKTQTLSVVFCVVTSNRWHTLNISPICNNIDDSFSLYAMHICISSSIINISLEFPTVSITKRTIKEKNTCWNLLLMCFDWTPSMW